MTNVVDLNGWDTVFVLSTDKMNALLASETSATAQTWELDIQSGSATATWTFGAWQIASADGNKMALDMPFLAGSTLSVTRTGVEPVQYALDMIGWLCTVTVQPFWTAPVAETSRLMINTASGSGWASVKITAPAGTPMDAALILQIAISGWFDQSQDALKLFEREFAILDMADQVAQGGVEWLKPFEPAYVGGRMADGRSAVAMLAMASSTKSAVAAELALSPYALPENAEAAFLISTEVFFRSLILPAVASAYSHDGTGQPSHFRQSGDTMDKISNIAELSFPMSLNGEDQTATLPAGGLTIEMDVDRIAFSTRGLTVTTGYPGISGVINSTELLAVSLVEKPGAQQSRIFMLNDTNTAQPEITISNSTGAVIAESVIGALLVIIGAAIAVVSFKGPLRNRGLPEQTAKILARVIAGLVTTVGLAIGLSFNVIGWVKNGQIEQIPDLSNLIASSLARFSWPGNSTTTYEAKEADLAGCLRLTIAVHL